MAAYELLYHDLITVPLGERKPGIYWLRLFATEEPRWLAIVTEVPGNPSTGITNAISRVAEYLLEKFQIDPTRLLLYRVWPPGPGGDLGIKRVEVGEYPSFRRASRTQIERQLNKALPELPRHDELYERVLTRGGGRIQEIYRDVFEAVATSELPPPHNPWKCAHRNRFETIRKTIAKERTVGNPQLLAGRRFLESLSREDLATCPYHQHDWAVIANESVRILGEVGPADRDRYVEEARRVRLGKRDRKELEWPFDDPIVLGDHTYTNGQHRGCAARFSGATRVAVVVGEEKVGEQPEVWIYRGGG